MRRTPQRIAVVSDGLALTYAELDAQADHRAHQFATLGVQPDCVVAMMMHRSPEVLVTVLAILKTGAAYLLIDPDDPPKHIRCILDDTTPRLLVSTALNCCHSVPTTGCSRSRV